MSSNVIRKQRPSSIDRSNSKSLLAALKVVHLQIEATFAELGAEAGEEVSDLSRFSNIRMRVGQALLTKRQVVDKVASHLIPLISADEATGVRELQLRDRSSCHLASQIIRDWPPDEIQRNWGGYCSASRDFRTGILGLISAEKELYYVLLRGQFDA